LGFEQTGYRVKAYAKLNKWQPTRSSNILIPVNADLRLFPYSDAGSGLHEADMCDAQDYREKAQLLVHSANTASNKQVRATLLSLAQSALLIAAQLETKQRAIEQIRAAEEPSR
jgi:hypothetical protein